MTFSFPVELPLCEKRALNYGTNVLQPYQSNGYPKVAATRKKRPFWLVKSERNGGRYFRNSTLSLFSFFSFFLNFITIIVVEFFIKTSNFTTKKVVVFLLCFVLFVFSYAVRVYLKSITSICDKHS